MQMEGGSNGALEYWKRRSTVHRIFRAFIISCFRGCFSGLTDHRSLVTEH
jgi:hypothetical protein